MTDAIRCTYNTRLAGWVSALVTTATFAFLNAAYDRVPIVVPVSFDAGNPYMFAAKSPGLVYLPFGMQLALGAVFAAVVAVVLWQQQSGADIEQRQRRAAAEQTAEAVAMLAAVWITFQAINAWRLTELWRLTFDPFIEIYVVALMSAFTASLVIAVRVGLQVRDSGAGKAFLHAPVLDGRPLASAGLAAVLALGIGAPLALLSVVWGLLTHYA
jgi:uncharacterized membrane protein